jgi:hypothetical protein
MYRKLHRILGLVLLLPFFGWAITGLVFFLKPGYEGAYEGLSPKTYPLEGSLSIHPDPSWLEFRCFRTILGDHLIARTADGWLHLNPRDLRPRSLPTEGEIRRLLTDAISANPGRYGKIVSLSGDTARTDTGVEITMDWTSLSLQQKGRDTERIDQLYKIHYLQWTGIRSLDRAVGFVGIVLVIALTLLGARLAIRA